MNKQEVIQVWKEVQDNLQTLDSCIGPHEFVAIDGSAGSFRTKYKCSKCGGTVNYQSKVWYSRGLIHARTSSQ